MKVPPLLLGGIALAATSLVAQGTMAPRPVPPMERPMSATADPIVASARVAYDTMKRYIVAAADEMPEKDYGSKPATRPAADKQEIRTFGQIIGHMWRRRTSCSARRRRRRRPPPA